MDRKAPAIGKASFLCYESQRKSLKTIPFVSAMPYNTPIQRKRENEKRTMD
jgi:hypothetical protein